MLPCPTCSEAVLAQNGLCHGASASFALCTCHVNDRQSGYVELPHQPLRRAHLRTSIRVGASGGKSHKLRLTSGGDWVCEIVDQHHLGMLLFTTANKIPERQGTRRFPPVHTCSAVPRVYGVRRTHRRI